MEGFFANAMKYLLFATNFLIMIFGCALLGVSIYILSMGKDATDLVSYGSDENESINLYSSAAILLIIISLFIIIVAFFGCCGALKENKCMLGTYFTLILILFIILIVAAIIGHTQKIAKIGKPLRNSMDKYGMSENKAVTVAWDNMQVYWECCGTNNYTEWEDSKAFPKQDGSSTYKVPESCCKKVVAEDKIKACRTSPKDSLVSPNKIPGCLEKLSAELQGHKIKVLAVAITFLVIMFLNMLFAFALCAMVK